MDLRHIDKSEDQESTEWPIIDHLEESLPKRSDKPYLSAFVLSHPDKDHVQGFEALLKRVEIGELWYTPRVLRDYEENEDLCDDAVAFRNEAERRRKATLNNPENVQSGDRIKVIGHDDILSEDKYADLPESCKVVPGNTIEAVDGNDLSNEFRVFVHAPFSDDQAKERNNTSLAIQVALFEGEKRLEALFFGDREYPTVSRIFRVSEEHDNEQYLAWDVLLSPHHCSKKVMFFQTQDEDQPSFKEDIMEDFDKYAKDSSHIVASALSDFSDEKGKNPPHQKAREKYEEVVNAGNFLCTHEYPNNESPEPIVFELTNSGIAYPILNESDTGQALGAAVSAARGESKPPSQHVGFGKTV